MKEISLDGMKLQMPDDFAGDGTRDMDGPNALTFFLHEHEDAAYRQAVNDCLAALEGIGDAQTKLRTLLNDWEKGERPPDVWLA